LTLLGLQANEKNSFSPLFYFSSACSCRSYKVKLRAGQQLVKDRAGRYTSVISKVIVNQKAKIQVVFPGTTILIDVRESAVAYKTAEDTIIFFLWTSV
jgi:hypothetical protein